MIPEKRREDGSSKYSYVCIHNCPQDPFEADRKINGKKRPRRKLDQARRRRKKKTFVSLSNQPKNPTSATHPEEFCSLSPTATTNYCCYYYDIGITPLIHTKTRLRCTRTKREREREKPGDVRMSVCEKVCIHLYKKMTENTPLSHFSFFSASVRVRERKRAKKSEKRELRLAAGRDF